MQTFKDQCVEWVSQMRHSNPWDCEHCGLTNPSADTGECLLCGLLEEEATPSDLSDHIIKHQAQRVVSAIHTCRHRLWDLDEQNEVALRNLGKRTRMALREIQEQFT